MRRNRINPEGRILRTEAISGEEFTNKMKEAIALEPIARAFRLSDITIEPDSVKYGYIKVQGKDVLVSDGFFRDLARTLNFNTKLVSDYTSKKSASDQNSEFLSKLIGATAGFKGSRNDQGITLVADSKTNTVTNAVPSRNFARIPNERLFGLAQSLVGRHPELTPWDVTGQPGSPRILLASNSISRFEGSGITGDESFRFGIMLGNNPTSTNLCDFNLRLVCSNGMMVLAGDFKFKLEGLDDKHLGRFFENIANYSRSGFIPTTFESNLNAANSTEASFREIEQAFNKCNSLIPSENGEFKKHLSGKLVNEYFPGYGETFMKLAKQGINPAQLTDKQKSFVKSGQCIWDVINSVTFLGSHQTDLNLQNNASLLGLGGKIFASEYDLQYADLLKA